MSRFSQIQEAWSRDTGGQWVFPKLGKQGQNAETTVLVRVSAFNCGNGRSPAASPGAMENQGFRADRTTGDTGVFGKDFGKIFGNVLVPSVAFFGYERDTRHIDYRGGCNY